jgi:hypothetical protein
MRHWLIYEPPGGARRTLDEAMKFETVREGFSKVAFLAPFVWLAWRRCWLALALYLAAELVLVLAANLLQLEGGTALVFSLLPNVAIGLESSWLRARALEREGFTLAGSVLARSREEAEALFFSDWLGNEPVAARPAQPAAYAPLRANVLSMFPEPGSAR